MSTPLTVSKINEIVEKTMKEKLIIKEFDDFNEKHDIKYSKKKIDQRKVYFFMFCAAKENKYINGREDCNVILIKLGIYSKSIDSIQRFNKIEQKGYKRKNVGFGKYQLIYPLEYVPQKLKMRDSVKSPENKDEIINSMKYNIKKNYLDVSNDKWQIGHANPELPYSEGNIMIQPPLQARYRDRYIWIKNKFDIMLGIPSPKELNKLLKKKEIIFTNEQIKLYFEIFKSRLE